MYRSGPYYRATRELSDEYGGEDKIPAGEVYHRMDENHEQDRRDAWAEEYFNGPSEDE